MPHINRKHPNTKLQIIWEAARMFVDEGYSKSSISKIAKNLDLSLGNITFYFKTKEHLLAVLTDEMFEYQRLTMQEATDEGKSSLLAYCLELTAMAAVCESSEIARDFYASAYSSQCVLPLIRENDTEKVKEIFAQFCPDWTHEQWVATENVVSGIEFATIMTREEHTPLPLQIEKTLDTILYLFGVPADLRRLKIAKVLAMDYRALGDKMLKEFPEYVKRINEENLRNSVRQRRNKQSALESKTPQ